jgi:hypothetical protein
LRVGTTLSGATSVIVEHGLHPVLKVLAVLHVIKKFPTFFVVSVELFFQSFNVRGHVAVVSQVGGVGIVVVEGFIQGGYHSVVLGQVGEFGGGKREEIVRDRR